MSDIPQAPDWWQANDGKWYPPQAGTPAPDPFQQMQQGTTTPPAAPNPFATGMMYNASTSSGRGCMSLGMIITITTLLIGGAITAVVLFAVKDASDTIDETFDTDNEALDSVTITEGSCGRDAESFNWGTASVDVTNDTDHTSTYFITVTFENAAGSRQFGTGTATATSLAPGRTTTIDVSSTVEVPAQVTCTVTDVNRIST